MDAAAARAVPGTGRPGHGGRAGACAGMCGGGVCGAKASPALQALPGGHSGRFVMTYRATPPLPVGAGQAPLSDGWAAYPDALACGKPGRTGGRGGYFQCRERRGLPRRGQGVTRKTWGLAAEGCPRELACLGLAPPGATGGWPLGFGCGGCPPGLGCQGLPKVGYRGLATGGCRKLATGG